MASTSHRPGTKKKKPGTSLPPHISPLDGGVTLTARRPCLVILRGNLTVLRVGSGKEVGQAPPAENRNGQDKH